MGCVNWSSGCELIKVVEVRMKQGINSRMSDYLWCEPVWWLLYHCCKRSVKLQRIWKISKGAKIMNRYKQVPHLTQDTNGKVTYSQLDTTNESQEVSPFPAGDHKAHINRRSQRHSKHKKDPQNTFLNDPGDWLMLWVPHFWTYSAMPCIAIHCICFGSFQRPFVTDLHKSWPKDKTRRFYFCSVWIRFLTSYKYSQEFLEIRGSISS